jgi:hypothetical protein
MSLKMKWRSGKIFGHSSGCWFIFRRRWKLPFYRNNVIFFLYICLFVFRLSVCLPGCMSCLSCLPVCLPACRVYHACLPACLYACLCLSVRLPFCLSEVTEPTVICKLLFICHDR